MSVSDNDLELLEMWLDGELSAEESLALTARLESEPALAGALKQLRAERALRQPFWDSLQTDPASAEAVIGRVQASMDRRRVWSMQVRWMSAVASAAACLVVGLMIGRFLLAPAPTTPAGNSASVAQNSNKTDPDQGKIEFVGSTIPGPYEVQLADPTGRIIGVQHFNSLEEARQFTEDVNRMQQRPSPLSPYRDSRIVPASAEQF